MSTATEVETVAHHAAGSERMALYGHLVELLTYPTPELLGSLADGACHDGLQRLLHALPYAISVDLEGLRVDEPDGLASAYIALFDVPMGGATCPLYGGVLLGDRRQVMEDLLRMYRYFGLTTANAELRDLPDSITTALEFLQFLTYREGEASGEEVVMVRRAQCDLLERYVARWAPLVARRVAALDPPATYRSATALFEAFVTAELRALADPIVLQVRSSS